MELNIKVLTGETRTVTVNPSSTICDLKCKVAERFNSSTSRLKLFINNGQKVQLDIDLKTVSDYGLRSGSTVMLVISTTPEPFQVFVKNDKGLTKTYEVKEDDTVHQLMVKVFHKEGVPVDQQRLIHNNRQLESGKTLKDYNIISGSAIQMVLRLRGG